MLTVLEAASQQLFDRLGRRTFLASAALVCLLALAALPGLLRLAPVDRTEVIFAGASRALVAEGRLLDPSYAGEQQLHRPILTFWLQGMAAKIAGPDARDSISTYRWPSLLGVAIAVLATFHLLGPLLGGRTALLAAGYVAIAPVVAVLGDLAVADGIALGATTVALLALLRLYADPGEAGGARARGLAIAFWVALGLSIAINALAAPLVCLATLAGLAALDRRPDAWEWVSRLEPRWGVPLMMALASPWLIALAYAQGGVPFADMDWPTVLSVLGGAQVMKFDAPPLSFVGTFLLGFVPGTLLLGPALLAIWRRRDQRVPRFILAGIGGYLAYLELVSSKPALYVVPALFPLAGAAVALLVSGDGRVEGRSLGPLTLPAGSLAVSRLAVLGALLLPAGLFLLYWLTGRSLGPVNALTIVFTGLPMLLGAVLLARGLAASTVLVTFIGFALFVGVTLGLVLPDQRAAWPAERIKEAVGPVMACSGLPVTIIGYREPSALFSFGVERVHAGVPRSPEARAVAVVEDRWRTAFLERVAGGAQTPVAIGCVDAINVTRGCAVPLTIYAPGDIAARCPVEPRFVCSDEKRARRQACP